MKKFALAAMLAMALGAHARASVMEIVSAHGAVSSAPHAALTAPPEGVAVLQPVSSDLAEPAVFAMMLLGLCLIGFRARRDGSETFK
ncbi:PEP-CTERM sorting domain-containing protein [Massilia psychrophila]|uniref:PEP-CTERM protein-sorting domain-containing protein n=1 Tax=Massilia psychrophila TaxID=1603353 RepID=A0A2G8T820_9BURK|nr:PEP-CTERM sorting domain-containing protein [Massilia psychrophila]PIL41798.1 hypothetical protein CR103_01910 [Massilia psychrophila]GGE60048.1 hypothetical protein GCM10008020_00050 [Massilia psychrophila]